MLKGWIFGKKVLVQGSTGERRVVRRIVHQGQALYYRYIDRSSEICIDKAEVLKGLGCVLGGRPYDITPETRAGKKAIIYVMSRNTSLSKLNMNGTIKRELDWLGSKSDDMDVYFWTWSNDESQERTVLLQNDIQGNLILGGRGDIRRYMNAWSSILRMRDRYELRILRTHQVIGLGSVMVLAKIIGMTVVARMGYLPTRSIEAKYGMWDLRWLYAYMVERIAVILSDVVIVGSEFMVKEKCRSKTVLGRNLVDGEVATNRDDCKRGIIVVSRLEKEKGVQSLVEFIRKTEEDVVVVGAGTYGSLVMEVSKERDNITYREELKNTEVRRLMRASSIYLSFSKTEGSPKSLIEAIRCGLCPIVTDIDAHREIVGTDRGFLIKLSSTEQMCRDVEALLKLSDRQLAERGKRAEKWAAINLDPTCAIQREREIKGLIGY